MGRTDEKYLRLLKERYRKASRSESMTSPRRLTRAPWQALTSRTPTGHSSERHTDS
jgi:hypothetical protein